MPHSFCVHFIRLLSTLMLGLVAMEQAQAAINKVAPAVVPEQAASVAPAGRQQTYTYSFKALGAKYPFNLVGVDGRNTVGFSLREDEIVTKADVHLRYSYSTALIPELSSLNLLMNDELVSSIPLSSEQSGQSQEASFALPAWMFLDYNLLSMQFIGHYTNGCEDPQHSSLWAKVSNQSTLQVTTRSLKLPNDLALLPLPFYSARDNHKLALPFVYAHPPTRAQLESSGYVASWFGQLAGFRGAEFPVNLGSLPRQGNAVLFLAEGEQLPGLTLPPMPGPGLAVLTNPNDEYGKLLVIYGRDASELKLAAQGLILARNAFSGTQATVNNLSMPATRHPYDAPAWIRTDRPVRLGELVSDNVLSSKGQAYDVIRVPLRFPPDLFMWNTKGVPLYLKYRYTSRPQEDKSALNISVNERFVGSERLLTSEKLMAFRKGVVEIVKDEKQLVSATKVTIPDYLVTPYSELTLHFLFDKLRLGDCGVNLTEPLKVKGSIEPNSTIDISGFKHYIKMPNLAAFANTGFPFTRLADLSETAVVLPEAPDTDTIAAYLRLMGRMGEATGYPALKVSVLSKADLSKGLDKDLIVFDKSTEGGIAEHWRDVLPMQYEQGRLKVRLSNPLLRAWYSIFPEDEVNAYATIEYQQADSDAYLAGFESPFKAGRSVALLSAPKGVSYKQTLDALFDVEKGLPNVQGAMVSVHADRVRTLSAETTYALGTLGPMLQARWYLTKHPFLSNVIALLVILLISVILNRVLNAKARQRLHDK